MTYDYFTEPPYGLRMLAVAVIAQAVRDLTNPYVKPRTPEDRVKMERELRVAAEEFLTVENEDLEFWCIAASLSMQAVIKRSKQLALEYEVNQ